MHAKLPMLRQSVRRLLDYSCDVETEETVDYGADADRWWPTAHDFSMRRSPVPVRNRHGRWPDRRRSRFRLHERQALEPVISVLKTD